jgi:hypothetical protein
MSGSWDVALYMEVVKFSIEKPIEISMMKWKDVAFSH